MALIILSAISSAYDRNEIKNILEKHLNEVNSSIDQHEKLKKLIVVKENWTVENGLLTPSLKIKRAMIEKKYSNYYNQWHELTPLIIWQ
jgi:long-subunit acyl-CoA synthetase (AMP-forming)